MIFYTALSDFVLYIVISFLAGFVVLQFVPGSRKPVLRVPGALVTGALFAIPVLAAAPVVQLVFLLAESRGLATAAWDVLSGFRSGQNFAAGVGIALVWLLAVRFRASKYVHAALLVAVIMNVGYGSHAASIDPWPGFISHTVHVLALSLWAGVLLQVTWFGQSAENWCRFLGWFTPFAFACVTLLLVSGVAVMLLFVAPADYADSWILPYGQLLLLKHISIIPLLLAAWINGMRSRTGVPDRLWLKLESAMLLLVFLFTAFMSKLAPPHNVNNTFRSEGVAPLAEWLSGAAHLPIRAEWAGSLEGILVLFSALLFLGLALVPSRRNSNFWMRLVFCAAFVLLLYTGLMMNISF